MEQHLIDLRGEDSRSSSDSSEEDWLSEAVALRRNLTDAFDRQFTEPSSIVAQSSQNHSITDRTSHFEEGKRAVMTKPPMIPNRMIANNNIPADRFAVYLRIRPPSSYGKEKKQVFESNTIEILQPLESQTFPTKVRTYPPADSQTSKFNINLEGHGATSSAKEFEFHQVLAPTTTQQDLYSVVAAPLIQSLFQNSKSIEKKSNRKATLQKSALLFSYGITNSGKLNCHHSQTLSANMQLTNTFYSQEKLMYVLTSLAQMSIIVRTNPLDSNTFFETFSCTDYSRKDKNKRQCWMGGHTESYF